MAGKRPKTVVVRDVAASRAAFRRSECAVLYWHERSQQTTQQVEITFQNVYRAQTKRMENKRLCRSAAWPSVVTRFDDSIVEKKNQCASTFAANRVSVKP